MGEPLVFDTSQVISRGVGIESEEEFGWPQVNHIVCTQSVETDETFGDAMVLPGPVVVAPESIASGEAVGEPRLGLAVLPEAITSEEAFGTPQVNFKLYPAAIPSDEVFGTDAILPGPVDVLPSGIPGHEVPEPISITNPGFEADVFTEDDYSTGEITGWTIADGGNAGAWHVGSTGYYTDPIPNPDNVAWAWGTNALSQVLTESIRANYLYTLRVYVGQWGGGAPGTHNYQIQLVEGTGDTVLASVSGEAPFDDFALVEVSYLADDQFAGNPIKIVIRTTQHLDDGQEVDFDLVTIGAVQITVPAPNVRYVVGPAGIESGEAWGSPQVNLTLYPATIESEEGMGKPVMGGHVRIDGWASIPSEEAFGTPRIVSIVKPVAVASEEAFGVPEAVPGPVAVYPFSIESGEGFGWGMVRRPPRKLADLIVLEVTPLPTLKFADGLEEVDLYDSPLRMVVNG